MKIVKDYGNQELSFDNLTVKSNIKLDFLDDEILVELNNIINTQFQGGNIQENEMLQSLKDYLGIGLYSKAPCGGFVNFFKVKSIKGEDFVLYSGVNEVSNSHYLITIHKILKE